MKFRIPFLGLIFMVMSKSSPTLNFLKAWMNPPSGPMNVPVSTFSEQGLTPLRWLLLHLPIRFPFRRKSLRQPMKPEVTLPWGARLDSI